MPKDEINKAFEMYRQGTKLVDIAKALNRSEGTIRSWKSRNKWDKSVATENRNVAKKKGAPKGNKNATGPPGNKHASKHGLFERYLPQETLDIVNQIKVKSPLDLLWDQILLAYAAIVRAQKVMFVYDRNDHDVIKSGYKDGKISGEEFAVTSANDKQGTFLSSLSRVQAQLNNMIKQYDKMVREDPLATEEQKLRIESFKANTELTKAKIEALKGGNEITTEDKIENLFNKLKEDIADE